jgi:hypothetical protein
MIIFLLWLLATIDSAFIGYREAAGRNALINKRAYYQKAMLRGAFFGQIAIVLAGLLIAAAIVFSSEPFVLISELQQVGKRMLSLYLPYTFIIFFAFALRLIPSVDIKSITSTVIFGPFTLLRPFVAIAGMVYGFFAATKLVVFLLGGAVLSLMLSLEWTINRFRARNLIS